MANKKTTTPKGRSSDWCLKKADKAMHKMIHKKEKRAKNISKKDPIKTTAPLMAEAEKKPKAPRYRICRLNIGNWVKNHPEATEQEKQTIVCEILSDEF